MLTKAQLRKLQKDGHGEQLVAECLKHGTVLQDRTFPVAKGFYEGENRRAQIHHKGLFWNFEFRNGVLCRFGWETPELSTSA